MGLVALIVTGDLSYVHFFCKMGSRQIDDVCRYPNIYYRTKKQPLGNLSEGLFCYLDFDEEKDGMRLRTYRLRSVQMQRDKTHMTAYLA